MEECVFCSVPLAPGGEEHVFPASIGGRVITRRATCRKCNNDFSSSEGERIEAEFAEELVLIRNLLCIWTGRDGPPPTIRNAGVMPDGGVFELEPGAVPVIQRAKIPPQKEFTEGSPKQIIAKDSADVTRVLDVLRKRKSSFELRDVTSVLQKAPPVRLSITIGPKSNRVAAKIGIVACCVLFGNRRALSGIDKELCASVRTGTPHIMDFSGLDYANLWPQLLDITPHHRTPNAILSGFEHTAIICDVGAWWICYIQLFGDVRFSVRLGPRSGLEAKGIAINPRSKQPARFNIKAASPNLYIPRTSLTFQSEHSLSCAGINHALSTISQRWGAESHSSYSEQLAEKIVSAVAKEGDNEEAMLRIVSEFAEKIATLEVGGTWKEEFFLIQADDEDPKPSQALDI